MSTKLLEMLFGTTAVPVTHLYTTAGSATETIPSNVSNLIIEIAGSSGNGGGGFGTGCTLQGGGGGGSGGYVRHSIPIGGSAGKTMNYTITAAGTGTACTVTSGTFTVTSLSGGGGVTGGTASLGSGGSGGSGGAASGGNQANTNGNTGVAGGASGGSGAAGITGSNITGNAGGHGGTGAANIGLTSGGAGIIRFAYT